ncbi:hypothetical protein HMPREF9352_1446 [Streptococcus gallolyticus subsp. gallolyticus TX20005]|nr:hypothetical protein HMPREF9352_1446 [Streptococcus gallolyticus subsp. gallolyticus TX20005]
MSWVICKSFGTIRNSTALKQDDTIFNYGLGFGTIRNSTALKLLFIFKEK